MSPTAEDEIRFLVNLQRLLGEGSFVSTYKFALLMSLADICVERPDDNANGMLSITGREIAEKFIVFYWRQTLPYPDMQGEQFVFKQNTGKQAGVIRLLERARKDFGTLARLMHDQRAWQSLVSEVASIVRDMPLWKLQTVGSNQLEFLYGNTGRGSQITLMPGVAHCLRKFHALVGDLVRGAWTRYVRRHNLAVLNDSADLQEFLFGADRTSLAKVRPIMMEVQDGRCFYCERPVRAGNADVDHFVPWSMYPIDLGHNFVVAHKTCNNSKSDRLAAAEHLAHWNEMQRDTGEALTVAFSQRDIRSDLNTTRQINRWAYTSAAQAGGLTWLRKNELEPLPADLLTRLDSVIWQ